MDGWMENSEMDEAWLGNDGFGWMDGSTTVRWVMESKDN